MPVIDMDGVRALGRELSNWGRWGDDDQRGTLNLIEPARVSAAATAVRRGVSFSLAMPADENGPHDLRTSGRFNPIHSMTRYRGDTPRGEFTGGFASAEDMLIIGTHSSTHFDALAHLWYDDLLYNGHHHDDAVTARGAERCSIQNLASGVVSRGILADVPRHRGLDHLPPGTGVGPDERDAVLAARGVVPRPGTSCCCGRAPTPGSGAASTSSPDGRRGSPSSAPAGSATTASRRCARTTWPSRCSARTATAR
nr:hypothetical protein [Actinomadura sp. CNU-125]